MQTISCASMPSPVAEFELEARVPDWTFRAKRVENVQKQKSVPQMQKTRKNCGFGFVRTDGYGWSGRGGTDFVVSCAYTLADPL